MLPYHTKPTQSEKKYRPGEYGKSPLLLPRSPDKSRLRHVSPDFLYISGTTLIFDEYTVYSYAHARMVWEYVYLGTTVKLNSYSKVQLALFTKAKVLGENKC